MRSPHFGATLAPNEAGRLRIGAAQYTSINTRALVPGNNNKFESKNIEFHQKVYDGIKKERR